MLAGITVAVSRAGLQELRRVLQPQRARRDVGVIPAFALASGRVALSLVSAVVGIVVVAGVARRVLLSIAVAVIVMVMVMVMIMIMMMITGFTAWAGRTR
ncbi:hypothetical protein [Mesorhizobium sp. 43Arga]